MASSSDFTTSASVVSGASGAPIWWPSKKALSSVTVLLHAAKSAWKSSASSPL